MRLFFKIALISFVIAAAQAQTPVEPAYEGDTVNKDSCVTSAFIERSHLSCIVCGLKKAGRPAPDENFIALMGLLVRENTALFEDEKNPTFKNQSRRSLSTNQSISVSDKKTGQPIEFTTRAQMQKNTLQLLLASGYCTQGKIKSKSKEKDYSNFISRMLSDQHPVLNDVKKIREKAAKEVGYSDWDNAKRELLYDEKGSSFFALPYEQQQDFYKKRRAASISSNSDDFGYRPKSEIPDCISDIEQNYAPKYSSSEDAYTTCKVVYDECEIATNPNATDNKLYRDKEKKQRVGGDWCAQKYLTKAPVLAKNPEPASAPATTPAQPPIPKAPAVNVEGDPKPAFTK